MDIQRIPLKEWARLLPSSGIEVFHKPEALSVLDEHTNSELVLLGGFKGESPVALLPVFVRNTAVGKAVFSPPPKMGVPRLGPLIMPNSPKQTKREAVTRRFIDGVIRELNIKSSLAVVRIRCPPGFTDPRPFHWQSFDVEPAFTYLLDVSASDMNTLLKPFSSNLRRELKLANESELAVSMEGVEGADRIIRHVLERYDEQERSTGIERGFVRDLVDALDDRARVYVARDSSGQYLSGIITLVSNDAVYYWQGGVSESYEERLSDGTTRAVSVNALLHWTILEDIISNPELEEVDSYDLVGANTQRLCEYKSKFGGSLTPYYIVESTGTATKIAKSGYQFLRRHK